MFPYGRQPYIWAQDTTQDSFTVNYDGGWPYGNQVGWFSGAGTYGSANASAALSQWQLNVSSNAVAQWTNSAVQPNQESTGQISLNAGTLHASSNDSAFALGGAIIGYNPDQNAVAVGLTGMAVQDLTTGRWQNISTTKTLYGANGFGAFGEAVFLPGYGDQGVLAFVGGYAPNSQFFTWSDVSQDSLQDLSRIYMYDIASQTFFAQPVTGAQIPGPRWGFCAVGVEDDNGNGFDMCVVQLAAPGRILCVMFLLTMTTDSCTVAITVANLQSILNRAMTTSGFSPFRPSNGSRSTAARKQCVLYIPVKLSASRR